MSDPLFLYWISKLASRIDLFFFFFFLRLCVFDSAGNVLPFIRALKHRWQHHFVVRELTLNITANVTSVITITKKTVSHFVAAVLRQTDFQRLQ